MSEIKLLGRVAFVNKGAYDSTASYEYLDVVRYSGVSYIAKQNTTGNLPTNTTYWQEFAPVGSYTPTLNSAGILV